MKPLDRNAWSQVPLAAVLILALFADRLQQEFTATDHPAGRR